MMTAERALQLIAKYTNTLGMVKDMRPIREVIQLYDENLSAWEFGAQATRPDPGKSLLADDWLGRPQENA